MPRYFFDISTNEDDCDDDGVELADLAEARAQAVIFAGEYLSDHPELLDDGRRFCVTVREEDGATPFGIVMTVEPVATK